jgi:hypothetical protein
MKTVKLIEESKEKVSILKNVEPGKIVRFTHDSYEDAIKNDLFYCVVLNSREGRVKLFCIQNAELIERDDDWRVIEHESKLYIKPNIV